MRSIDRDASDTGSIDRSIATFGRDVRSRRSRRLDRSTDSTFARDSTIDRTDSTTTTTRCVVVEFVVDESARLEFAARRLGNDDDDDTRGKFKKCAFSRLFFVMRVYG